MRGAVLLQAVVVIRYHHSTILSSLPFELGYNCHTCTLAWMVKLKNPWSCLWVLSKRPAFQAQAVVSQCPSFSIMFPVNRVPDILRRMDMNTTQAEAMKTCFGILAIMSREDSNKALIAKDGMETILNVMTAHIDRTDVQEAGCDLLWSLAFNSGVVKEIIAKCTGSTVLVRALKRHSRSADFLKSACGALSNILSLIHI